MQKPVQAVFWEYSASLYQTPNASHFREWQQNIKAELKRDWLQIQLFQLPALQWWARITLLLVFQFPSLQMGLIVSFRAVKSIRDNVC